MPIEFGQDSIDKNSEHAAGVQKDSLLSKYHFDETVIEHFKRIEGAVAYFEEIAIYHFKGSIISKLLISKG